MERFLLAILIAVSTSDTDILMNAAMHLKGKYVSHNLIEDEGETKRDRNTERGKKR